MAENFDGGHIFFNPEYEAYLRKNPKPPMKNVPVDLSLNMEQLDVIIHVLENYGTIGAEEFNIFTANTIEEILLILKKVRDD